MKLREVQRLISRYVAPRFPELQLTADMLVRWDGDPILRGFVFERSQVHKDGMRLHAFAQPLFVPADVVYLSVGEPLGDFLFDETSEESEVMAELVELAEHNGRAILERVSDGPGRPRERCGSRQPDRSAASTPSPRGPRGCAWAA